MLELKPEVLLCTYVHVYYAYDLEKKLMQLESPHHCYKCYARLCWNSLNSPTILCIHKIVFFVFDLGLILLAVGSQVFFIINYILFMCGHCSQSLAVISTYY